MTIKYVKAGELSGGDITKAIVPTARIVTGAAAGVLFTIPAVDGQRARLTYLATSANVIQPNITIKVAGVAVITNGSLSSQASHANGTGEFRIGTGSTYSDTHQMVIADLNQAITVELTAGSTVVDLAYACDYVA